MPWGDTLAVDQTLFNAMQYTWWMLSYESKAQMFPVFLNKVMEHITPAESKELSEKHARELILDFDLMTNLEKLKEMNILSLEEVYKHRLNQPN